MGLPIWRDPEEAKAKKEQSKPDPTAEGRSPIRRPPRPTYSRRRRHNPRESSPTFPPRFERSPPPSVGFNGLRPGRRAENRGVPPVSTLLESADRRTALPPPAAETSDYSHIRMLQLDARERELRASIDELQTTADRLEDEARVLQEDLDLPSDWSEWSESERSRFLAAQPTFGRRSTSHELRAREVHNRVAAARSLARPQSRDGASARRSTLPTPPHDESGEPVPPSWTEGALSRPSHRRSHPLSNSWQPDSPINGLGDRIRSPTPGDGWDLMRSTITPDATLPSADSSFTSAAASQSFASTGTDTAEHDLSSSSMNSGHRTSRDGDQSASVSSVDPDDLVCTDEEEREREREADFAAALYAREMQSIGGQNRIRRNRADYESTGRRFAMPDEPEPVEIGFRLINEALTTQAGRDRIDRLAYSFNERTEELEERLRARRSERGGRTRGAYITDDEPPSPHPERYDDLARAAVREASDQVHDYFRRFTADSLASRGGLSLDDQLYRRTRSPPPRYEPLASHPEVNAFVSRDGPEPHPVSPPSTRSERDMGDAFLSGNESDLEPMRRIVERLARRDDVPDEWWMSMGLNLSRARARSRSPPRQHQASGSETATAGGRVRGGRVERGNSRL